MEPEELAPSSDEPLSSRLNRELNELLQELRVVQGGVLILVGFLLVIPFTQRFAGVTAFQRDVYYATLMLAGASAVVILAPVSHHRLAFRLRDKATLIKRGNQMVIAALALLALAILGVVILVTDFLFFPWLTGVMAAGYVFVVTMLWYILPARARRLARSALQATETLDPAEATPTRPGTTTLRRA
jgi:Family of unknown function (DUF6328)